MKFIITVFLSFVVAAAHAQDTFNVYFQLNSAAIDKAAEQGIDALVFKDKLIHGQKLIVLGYSDYVGDDKYNDALSLNRAQRVRDYLAVMGFDRGDIKLCTGKGKIQRNMNGKEGNAPDRKVQIIIDHAAVVTPIPATVAKPVIKPVVKPVVKTRFDTAHLEVNEAIALGSINFEGGSPEILSASYPALEELFTFMDNNSRVQIQIEGHVCCYVPNSADTTGGLSLMRAVSVGKYLLKKGIDSSRLKYAGYGTSRPLVREAITPEDMMRNRRVEIRILHR